MTMINPSVLCKSKWLVVWVLLVGWGPVATADESLRTPYMTGSHRQLVRDFYSTREGLPDDGVRAVVVTRSGAVIVACNSGLSRLEADRWKQEMGPTGVTALFGPAGGPEARWLARQTVYGC